MAESLATSVATVATIDYVLPSPLKFGGKEDFFANVNTAINTKALIEGTLIRAARIRYLTFGFLDDDEVAREVDGPNVYLSWELTIFHESDFERVDETTPQDDFEKRVRKTNQEHITAVWGVIGAMQGVNAIPALSAFAEAETVTPSQIDNTELDVECEFIAGCVGDQTKLELRVRVQLPC